MSRLITIGLLALAFALRPTHARCPAGTDLRVGVRVDGYFECWPAPVGDAVFERGAGAREPRWVDHSTQLEDWIASRIYCTGGATPRQDGLSVWCQR